MRDVYLGSSYCLSPSGSRASDVISDYRNAVRRLQVLRIKDDPDFGEMKVGIISQDNLGLSESIESCSSSVRVRAGFKKLFEQIGEDHESKKFDGVLIASGRLKSLNIQVLDKEMGSVFSVAQMRRWIYEELLLVGIQVPNEHDIFFVDGTCSSGFQVINMAWKRIQHEYWSNALLIGFDPYSAGGYSRLDALGVLSTSPLEESPKVFHQKRDGFIKAECFVGQEIHAGPSSRHDCGQKSGHESGHEFGHEFGSEFDSEFGREIGIGKKFRYRIRSSAVTTDASSLTAIHPSGRGLYSCIMNVLRIGGVKPEEIGLIKAHGTGTLLNDRVEAEVVKQVFNEWSSRIPVISFKSQFGHMTNASGLFELFLTQHCLESEQVKAVPLSQPNDPECDIFIPAKDMELVNPKFALLLSLGFGGINSALILERVPNQ